MRTTSKRLVVVVVIFGLLGCSIAGWTAVTVVAWARDLPNRIVIDGDAMANAFASAVVQSYHEGLLGGDAQTQSTILNEFTQLANHDTASREWIREEYTADLQRLSSSPDEDVSALATELLTLLAEPEADDQTEGKSQDGN